MRSTIRLAGMLRIQLALALLWGMTHVHYATAAPWISPGDPTLRLDLYVLADAGLISTPMMAWPRPGTPVEEGIRKFGDRYRGYYQI